VRFTSSTPRKVDSITGEYSVAFVPELPDILLYLHALEPRVVGRRIDALELGSPFLLRSVVAPL